MHKSKATTYMNTLRMEIDNLSIEKQCDLHNLLENHLMAIGILEPYPLSEDQEIILEARIEEWEKGEVKGIPWEEVKKEIKEKYPDLNFENPSYDPLPQELIEKVFELPARKKMAIFNRLQLAADASFQQMLQEMKMTEDQWNKMHDEMYIQSAARYKKEADEIRRRKGLI